ncbi:hypothetical protein KIN20_026283 [Parelaphostrongylus tenuis]|uniref:Uncharacterized protein n=1 Tax=Parelaphostrongylus tenuis TaxID=148309 RepID=A0AAD5N9Q2_PARTN|nr:hypothetical protein KIN20_026283 [Parelaphostrongylus tenuis]
MPVINHFVKVGNGPNASGHHKENGERRPESFNLAMRPLLLRKRSGVESAATEEAQK